LSGLISILSNVESKEIPKESFKIRKAFFCKESSDIHSFKSEEDPLADEGRIMPPLFFFQPNNNPEMATTKKKMNKKAPVV
jgi:hypothetical protein